MRKYLSNILKCDTQSYYMKEGVYHWFDSFEMFHQKYIIMPINSYKYSIPEYIRYIAVIILPGFINQENKTRFYFNSTIQLLYCNVIFRPLILNIDFDTQ